MDNNTQNNNNPIDNLSLDPSLLAPQGVSPTTPTATATNHLIDITPGVPEPTPTPVSPVTPVQTAPLPDNKIIDITPSALSDFAPIPATPTPEPTPATPVPTPIVSAPSSEPLAPPSTINDLPDRQAGLQSTIPATPVASPLQEDPNLVKTIS